MGGETVIRKKVEKGRQRLLELVRDTDIVLYQKTF